MTGLAEHLAKDAPEYTALIGLFAVAVIANMPPPGSKTSWSTAYKWLYDSLQAFMAARSPRPPEAHIQTSQQTPGASLTQDATFPVAPVTTTTTIKQ